MCAAVSALAQTAIISITRIACVPQKIEQENGFLKSVIDLSESRPEYTERCRTIISTFMTGIFEIIRINPDRIKAEFTADDASEK